VCTPKSAVLHLAL